MNRSRVLIHVRDDIILTRDSKYVTVKVYTYFNGSRRYPYNSKKRGWNVAVARAVKASDVMALMGR